MIFLCRLSDSSSNISQSLAFVKHFFQLFQFIVFNNSELFLLLLQFSLLFLNCFCCVCVVFSDVDYNTTLPRVCQLLFYVFLHFFTLSLLLTNTQSSQTPSQLSQTEVPYLVLEISGHMLPCLLWKEKLSFSKNLVV